MAIVHLPLEKGIMISLPRSVAQTHLDPGGPEALDEVAAPCLAPDPESQQDQQS